MSFMPNTTAIISHILQYYAKHNRLPIALLLTPKQYAILQLEHETKEQIPEILGVPITVSDDAKTTIK